MVQKKPTNNNNNIVQQQLDVIKQQGLWSNESELNLEENRDLYSGLYENGLSKEELARRIIDQRNIADSKDYFSDIEQIQKANSYANDIIKNIASEENIKREKHEEEIEKRKAEIAEGDKIKMEDLQNMLQDKPENAEKNAETIVEQAKTRLKETMDRYTKKIKTMNESNNTEKEDLKKEIETIKAEIKTDKEKYEQVKKDFFASTNYNVENFTKDDLKKIPTKWVRYATRENKLFNAPKITKMKTYRRNMTIKKLINKFNKIEDKPKDGVRFVMGFEKARFLRYTGIKINTAFDKAGSAMGIQMNPQQFHNMFNAGRNNIFAILDADTGDEKTQGEKDMITALKKRINYYGYAYARERANARVTPFVEAEKTASEDERILEKTDTKKAKVIQMTQPQTTQAAA